jgi:hypothetical protein
MQIMTNNELVNLTSYNYTSYPNRSNPSHTPPHPARTPPDTATVSPYPPSPNRSTKRKRHSPIPYSPGKLGKWALQQDRTLAQTGWHTYFYQTQHPHSLNPSIHRLPHPTAHYLHRLAWAGAPASFSRPWSPQQISTAFQCGPHVSAACHYTDFFLADMYNYAQMGYWTVISQPSNATLNYGSRLPALCPNETVDPIQ